ncbi:uncharacterized protein E0L32_000153 [Thyridium curvatum]|uniref:O-acyltransferase n=1 Tax=Thyridium curvatum TaxID=1093900 RepID=A0A507BEW5_9PEZI|nr:uncharacterized protein E0L32_000153 [Thyridium curvatum]TPX15819.1 hypothetical protein E0L32_000153 [Thyridium curvatum]
MNGDSRPNADALAGTPHSLRDALRANQRGTNTPSDTTSTTSEEDYDEISKRVDPSALRRRPSRKAAPQVAENGKLSASDARRYILSANDAELQAILQRGLDRAHQEGDKSVPQKRRTKFGDLVFTRTFSAFDRQNADAANSPFHGFFTLFWIGVFLFVLKIGANNWRLCGNVLGTNEIMKTMFHRDVVVLLASDGAMCAITGVSWLLQRYLVLPGYVDWNGAGWILQNLWQAAFMAGVVGWTMVRDWPWSHTVFFVLHGIVMLMKQHSYAFYNGHLSTLRRQRADLLAVLKRLEGVAPIEGTSATDPPVESLSTDHLALPPSAAGMQERRRSITTTQQQQQHEQQAPQDQASDIDRVAEAIRSGEPLDEQQIHVFERIIKWEVDALQDELRGKALTPGKAYPHNLTFANHYEYIVLPTVVYELEYPRSESINWFYVVEKMTATFGIIFVMIMISQAFIYPVVMKTVTMKEMGMTTAERFREFPWMLSDLIFPFMMEYLLTWYLIWETILNWLAELTYFADRSFYDAWWNSVTWDQFARDWNRNQTRPVHNFLLRHVYHSSISALKVKRSTATLITFFLSACVHELIMWCIFKKLRGYLLFLQMCQIPVSIALSYQLRSLFVWIVHATDIFRLSLAGCTASYQVAAQQEDAGQYRFLVWPLHGTKYSM